MARIQRNEKPAKKKTTKKRPEADFTNVVIKYYMALGYFVLRINSGMVKTEHGFPFFAYTVANTAGHSGLPDLLIVKDDYYEFIEIKTDTGRLSDSQKRMQTTMDALGVRYRVLQPKTFQLM